MANARAKAWRIYEVRRGHDVMLAGPAGCHIAGDALVAWVFLMITEGRVFTLASLPLVDKPLPLLGHFRPKRFEARIGC